MYHPRQYIIATWRSPYRLVLGKINQVSLTIGQILGTAAENTGWLTWNSRPPPPGRAPCLPPPA